MGYKDPANWDESWRVYGSDLAANGPVANEEWYNFDGVNKKLKALEKKVKKLEEAAEDEEK